MTAESRTDLSFVRRLDVRSGCCGDGSFFVLVVEYLDTWYLSTIKAQLVVLNDWFENQTLTQMQTIEGSMPISSDEFKGLQN